MEQIEQPEALDEESGAEDGQRTKEDEPQKPIDEAIIDTLKRFNETQRIRGAYELQKKELLGLRSLLLVAVQRSVSEYLEDAASMTEAQVAEHELNRAYNVMRLMLQRLAPGDEITFTEEDIDLVRDRYLKIDRDGATTTLELHIEDPSQ